MLQWAELPEKAVRETTHLLRSTGHPESVAAQVHARVSAVQPFRQLYESASLPLVSLRLIVVLAGTATFLLAGTTAFFPAETVTFFLAETVTFFLAGTTFFLATAGHIPGLLWGLLSGHG